MDETGVVLSVLSFLKVLRTLVTAIECVSADGRCLAPLIVWPASTHRSTWTTHPTPGWHFACSKTGYTDTEISLSWIRDVFDSLTKDRASHKPRILINDGFGTHESLELMKFYYENNIVLCRLPSHTSHKLQPCDVGYFGPLKTAYREQVEQLYRGGANTVGKQHFTLLYDRARHLAFTSRNIKSGWLKSGLYPFHPDRIHNDLQKPHVEEIIPQTANAAMELPSPDDMLRTPVTFENLTVLRTVIEQDAALDHRSSYRFQKLANAAEKAFADRAMLLDENKLLFEQNDKRTTRLSVRSNMVGKAKVMTYEDIVAAQRKRDVKEATIPGSRRGRPGRPRLQDLQADGCEVSRAEELEHGRNEIRALGFEEYCTVLRF